MLAIASYQEVPAKAEIMTMLKSDFALSKVMRLVNSVSPWAIDRGSSQDWGEWSRHAEEHLQALADAGNDRHSPGTHWIEREVRFPGADRADQKRRLFEIRIAWRFPDDPEDLVRGNTPWWPDLPMNRQTLEMFLTAACEGCPHALHWLERRVA